MIDVQKIPSGQLMNEYRDMLLVIGADRAMEDTRADIGSLMKRADQYEEEINRRIAW